MMSAPMQFSTGKWTGKVPEVLGSAWCILERQVQKGKPVRTMVAVATWKSLAATTAVDLERNFRQREGDVTMERTLGACGLPRH